MKRLALGVAISLALAACQNNNSESTSPAKLAQTTAAPAKTSTPAINVADLNTEVRPQDDFWRYVNGKWLDRTKIPADKSRWGSFSKLGDQSRADVKAIIEDLSKSENLAAGSSAQKVRDLFNSYMDTDRINQLGVKPIQPELDAIAAIADKQQLAAYFAHAAHLQTRSPLGFFVNQDSKNPTAYIVYVSQSGLGLPDRDYYFRKGEKADQIRAKYLEFATRMFELGGFTNPAASAKSVYELEKALAEHQWTRVQNRDRDKTYNKFTSADMQAMANSFPWSTFLKDTGLDQQAEFVVRQPSYLKGFDQVFAKTDLDTWKNYTALRILASSAPLLSDDFYNASFEFYNKTLRGQQVPEDRWKRGVNIVNRNIGSLVGQEYVKRHFPPQAKARMLQLVHNLEKVLATSIDNLDWMAPETKAQAHDKLAKFTPKIGYPDKWRDYSGLDIKAGDLVGNMARAAEFDYNYQLNKLGGPINRDEWFMNPQTVNAYYNPQMNEIVFPAAILQPPFFDMNADDAVNYGGIGAVIGHEMGHGFDDQGRKSDGNGLLQDWWTEEDATRFNERAQRLVEEYNRFSPIEGMNVNGQLTLGENIGDLGGLEIAYTAYHLSLHGKEAPVIDGLTGDQRFFLGFAQIWKGKMRDQITAAMLASNPHSPVRYRVNGVVPNVDAWYDAFHVTPDDSLYVAPENRVHIW